MAQSGTWLACRTVDCGYILVLAQPGEIPPCPKCKQDAWRTMQPEPALELTGNDRRFLKSLRITAEP